MTIRENTERHLTVSNGANRVTGFRRASILDAVHWAINLEERHWPEIYGAPGVGEKIVSRILNGVTETALLASPTFA